MGEIDKKHINEFIKGQMTEYIYIALSDLVFVFFINNFLLFCYVLMGTMQKKNINGFRA